MPVSLYTATVPSFRQMLGSVAGLLDKAEAHCAERKLDPTNIIRASLAEDMLPFANQVKFAAMHSAGAIEGVRKGTFSPDLSPAGDSFDALRQTVSAAQATLDSVDPQEVDGFEGRDMRFEFRDFRLNFTAEDFLLSFSLPNLYFHATTAYDIMRMKGVELAKTDFLGRVRIKS